MRLEPHSARARNCEPNALVAPIHSMAMPVILDAADYETWLTGPWNAAKELANPFDAKAMRIAA